MSVDGHFNDNAKTFWLQTWEIVPQPAYHVTQEMVPSIGDQDLGEGAVARLTQLLLRSREAAITPLEQEIEAPLITSPAGQPTP